ncbi:Hpt domain-containing protein [Pararhodobacter zhoushanensis]|uniref:Hpt domain-containing protein n=1 Tax=Pararhodobacter zhoushanensis TaxID=2479545 RepID=A0ABT3GY93_9RHOB|nr:Hpt domain-containing protein [Pararhodobacter zhoushanensis]MCW1932525.1 Hpt domain-containing protein [Pararhodobacter zhoushanensis]
MHNSNPTQTTWESPRDIPLVSPQDAVEAAIEELRPRYQIALGEYHKRLEGAFYALLRGAGSAEDLRDVVYIAHRIAGTAGNFGLDDLGQRAREVDEALGPIADAPKQALRHLGLVARLIAALSSTVNKKAS